MPDIVKQAMASGTQAAPFIGGALTSYAPRPQNVWANGPAVSWGSTSANPGAYMSYSAALGNAS